MLQNRVLAYAWFLSFPKQRNLILKLIKGKYHLLSVAIKRKCQSFNYFLILCKSSNRYCVTLKSSAIGESLDSATDPFLLTVSIFQFKYDCSARDINLRACIIFKMIWHHK